jgi:transposase
MSVAIAITRRDLTAGELRAAAARTKDAGAARRMLAIALVLDGADRRTAAEACGMDRQTLRDWVHRYNAEGLAGLANRRAPARARRLTPAQVAELVAWVEAGPDPARDGVVRWRRIDLKRRIAAAFDVELHERTVGKYLAAQGYRRLSVRPRHPKADPEAQEAFKKTSPKRSRRRSPSTPGASRSRSGSRTRRGSASRAR